jgi:hypothetical protein
MNRLSNCLVALLILVNTTVAAGQRPSDSTSPADCLQMTVAASDIASYGGQARQHYKISFENRCDSVRVVYWCAEPPSKTLIAPPICASQTTASAGFAAPLYSVVRQRQFQWTFPQGTRIRYVDCNDSTYPTSDFRCSPAGPRMR